MCGKQRVCSRGPGCLCGLPQIRRGWPGEADSLNDADGLRELARVLAAAANRLDEGPRRTS